MSFTSLLFVVFVACVLLVYYIVPARFQWLVLLLASVIFYLKYDIKAGIFIVLSTILVWAGALKISKAKSTVVQKVILITVIALNVLILIGLKYATFLRGFLSSHGIIVPLGISFYTLALIGYLIDVYRKKIQPETNFLRVLLFTSYFPHILQGPIARYQNLMQQFDGKKKALSYQQLTMALQLIIWGYIKKLVIADRAGIFVDNVYDQYLGVGGTMLFVASLLYTIQIYADFSGCVDIALGVSELFGIKLQNNFSQPYLSISINDFWRRWHITLSSWFRDYLYIPLGGNRKGKVRRWLNVLIVFTVSGLWHGVGLTYIIWGFIHGIYQVIGAGLKPVKEKLYIRMKLINSKFLYIVKLVVNFLLINQAWIMFRATSPKMALYIMGKSISQCSLWQLFDQTVYQYGVSQRQMLMLLFFIIIMVFVDILHEKVIRIREMIGRCVLPVRWGIYLAALFSIILFGVYGIGYDAADFIYMRF